MHIEQRLEFIDSLPALPTDTSTRASPAIKSYKIYAAPNEDKAGGTVGPEMINIYLAGVSEQNRKDVDNCKLLVQNAASRLYDPLTEMHAWFDYYLKSLSKLGWITQTTQTREQTIQKSGLTMDAVAMYALAGLVGPNATVLAALMGKALEGLKDDNGLINIYNRKTNVGRDAKFDMSPVWQSNEGSPMMILNCNTLNVSESTRGILWWKSTSQSTRIKTAAQAVYLNVDVYSQVRAGVLQKLGQAANDYLGQLPDFE
jgi:hypothetical protein